MEKHQHQKKFEVPKSEPESIQVEEITQYLTNNPEAQQEILGAEFSQKEIASKMTFEVIAKTMERMGRPIQAFSSLEEVAEALERNPKAPMMTWNAEKRVYEEYDPSKGWPTGETRVFGLN